MNNQQQDANSLLRSGGNFFAPDMLAILFHETPDAIFLSDPQGRHVDVNPAAANLTGYSREELCAMRLPEILPEQDLELFTQQFAQEQKVSGTCRMVCKNNSEIVVDMTASLLAGDSILWMCREKNETPAAHPSQDKNDHLRTHVFECSRVPVYVVDPADFSIIDCNPAGVEILGLASPAQVLGRHPWDFSPVFQYDGRKTLDLIPYYTDRVLAEGAVIFEWRLKRPDGEIWDLEIHLMSFSLASRQYLQLTVQNITERKKAEDELRSAKQWLEHVVEFMPDAIMIADNEKRVIAWNRTMERMTGIPKAKIIGESQSKASLGFYGTERNFLVDLVFEHNDELAAQYSNVRHDGTTLYAEAYAPAIYNNRGAHVFAAVSPLYDDEDNFVGLIESIRDITQIKLAEEALKKSEERFKAQYHGSPVPTYTWQRLSDGDFELVDFNQAGLILTQGAVEGYMHQRISQIGIMQSDIWHDMRRCVEEKTILKKEVLSQRLLPGRYLVATYAYVPHDLVIIHLEDTTERHLVEQALRESEEKFSGMFKMSPEIIAISRLEDGALLEINEAFERKLGYARQGVIGYSYMELGIWEQPGDLTRMVQAFQEHGGILQQFETNLRCKDGRVLTVLVSAAPIETRGARLLMFIATDITEHHAVEEEKIKLQQQLLQAQKMESIGRLAGGLAHDFNNMLTAILGHTELALLTCPSTQPSHKHLLAIEKSANRSAALTRQLLGFARKQAIAPRVVDINETITGMLGMLRRLISEDTELIWLPGKGVWPVKIDASQVDQVLANLCVNASDAIQGIGRITISTDNVVLEPGYCRDYPGSVPGEYVLFCISDNGCGMDKVVQDQIFEPFFTTKEAGKGTGLGLATVYGIVKQNNGFIYVSSAPGRGSTFSIFLPRVQAVKQVIAVDEPVEIPVSSGETVLMVEDEIEILDIAQAMLESLGYTVLSSSSPEQAISLAREHGNAIRLLITDVIMPEMNGRELADNIQALIPGIKCLFSSGYTADIITSRGILVEGVHFLQKPFSKKEFAHKVREALQ